VRLRKNTFNQCVFNATTMKGVDFTACHFGECHFTGCSFARGVWGGGGRNSYSQCSFKKCKLTNSTIAYIEFFACDFENNKFRATFNGTVFEKCKFSGVISDCNFAGGDFSEEQKKYLGVRKLGGFYEVDLGNMWRLYT